MHIFISPVLNSLQSDARSGPARPISSEVCAVQLSTPPTKDDISSLLNRQRAHCTLCRVVIKKASGGKKSQWWFSLMVVVHATRRDEDVIGVAD